VDYMPPAYVQKVCDARWARYVVKDGIGQYFTGSGWSENPSEAVLYYTEGDALAARIRYCSPGDLVRDTFVASIVVVTVGKGEWTPQELATYLRRRGRFFLQHASELKAIAVEVIVDDLKHVKDVESTDGSGEPAGGNLEE